MKALPRPERRTRRDIIATCVIILLTLIVITGTWWGSQQSRVDHSVDASQTIGSDSGTKTGNNDSSNSHATQDKRATQLPKHLSPAWEAPTTADRQLVAGANGVLSIRGTRVSMLDARTGKERWHYDQQREICGVASPSRWTEVVVVFRSPKGCGEAISFDMASGQYAYTRDALAQDDVTVFAGDTRAGTISPRRIEIWRDDLVRTVEVGYQEAPTQPDQQKYVNCSFTSAQTYATMLATASACPDDDSKKLVRLLDTTPEKSDQPEIYHEFTVPAGAEVVAAAQNSALIYIPPQDDHDAKFQLLNKSGDFENLPAQASPGVEAEDQSRTDGPVAMWFDGARLNVFGAEDLHPRFQVDGALGTGAMMAGALLVPVPTGIAVIDPAHGTVERTIPVERHGYTGPITLRISGDSTIVEQRADTLVGLTASP
ncbi:hypothetical protein [Corynebacterium anserum]|uniref:Uncharacterized protein n=1 Tax=Corynebacterium anserum TaxID=2684406 RepID=A0A7G7YPM5_9CORY|nr:hypothetical protein [Corynebacterium anserum]MBC2682082.1 hypothetical protein [Corynebacterium anserum]QNH96445.1 hypothetical protein GP473_07070 [Corynebacterium anserum]